MHFRAQGAPLFSPRGTLTAHWECGLQEKWEEDVGRAIIYPMVRAVTSSWKTSYWFQGGHLSLSVIPDLCWSPRSQARLSLSNSTSHSSFQQILTTRNTRAIQVRFTLLQQHRTCPERATGISGGWGGEGLFVKSGAHTD